jgi:superfamily II DNA or RNA helicase
VKLTVEQMKKGHVSLVFSHRVEHCFDIRARIVEHDHRVGIIVGEPKYKQESSESLRQIVTGEIIAAVGTVQSIGTGIDLPAAARGIATTPMHSNKQQAGQMRGRLCRVDRHALDIQIAGRLRRTPKTDSILYVLWDRKVHGLVPLRQWLRINDGNVTVYDPETGKTEPGRAFLKRAEREESEML